MRLFDSEKDLILKIVNLLLLVWLIAAIAIFQSNIVDVLIPDYTMTYNEYESAYCMRIYEEEDAKRTCEDQYKGEQSYQRERSINQKKNIFIWFGNIVIVSVGISLLNKKKK